MNVVNFSRRNWANVMLLLLSCSLIMCICIQISCQYVSKLFLKSPSIFLSASLAAFCCLWSPHTLSITLLPAAAMEQQRCYSPSHGARLATGPSDIWAPCQPPRHQRDRSLFDFKKIHSGFGLLPGKAWGSSGLMMSLPPGSEASEKDARVSFQLVRKRKSSEHIN